MKILFLTCGDETFASSRTRVFQYLPYFSRQKIPFKVLILGHSEILGQRLHYYLVLVKFIFYCFFYEVIFIQKVLFRRQVAKIFNLFFRYFNKKVVFDFDDAIYTMHNSFEGSQERRIKRIIRSNFEETARIADLIVLENEFNKEYVKNISSNILTITGPIDIARYFPVPSSEKETIVIGWIGSPSTTVYLDLVLPVMQKIQEKHNNTIFKTIGANDIKLPNINIKQTFWNLKTEVSELHEFDIGIMPLTDDKWSQGKGGYKILQYMAIGIPVVASPVGINSKIVLDGKTGFLAQTQEEWYLKLDYLITHSEERKKMGRCGRQIAVEEYSFDVAAPLLINSIISLAQPTSISNMK